jgi:hypothetical protein
VTGPLGFSVRIFIPSGEPEGLRIVEKSNWTGQGLVFPRSRLGDVRKRPELARTGVYILWGPGESGQLPRAYVGEGDGVISRLDQHGKSKDFWTHAAVFTSKDQTLNKAHVQHLESRLVALATEAKRAEIDNSNAPQAPSLSAADIADAESFLRDLLLCLPVMGVSFFEKPRLEVAPGAELILKGRGIEARGVDGAEGFIVRAGSQAAKDEVESIAPYLTAHRAELVSSGLLADDGLVYRLTQNFVFDSPSSAAGVMLGRTANGRTSWRDAAGRTLKEIQDAATGGA